MKKLLSAVTSLVMAATFVSSAFTSSLVVSAAGSVPAVQPNVSMDGVKDVTANKNASNADFIIDFDNPDDENGYWHANPGEDVDVDMHITTKTSGLTVAGFSFDITVAGGITLADVVKSSPALLNAALVRDLKSGNINGTCEGNGDGITVKDGDLAYYTFNVPEGTPDGLYEIDLTKANLLKADKTGHNVGVKKGYIQVGDAVTPPQSSTTTTKATTTTKGNDSTTTSTTNKVEPSADGDFIIDFDNPDDENGYWHAKAGDDVDVDMHITTKTSGLTVAGFSFDITVAGGITLADVVKSSPALLNAALVRDLKSGNINGTCEGNGDGITVKDGDLAYYTFNVPEGTPDGLYEINLTKANLLKADKTNHNVGVKKGYIQVGDAVTPPQSSTTTTQSTTTKATTTTTATNASTTTASQQTTVSTTVSTATTTTTVTYKPAEGNAAWVIPEVHAQRGEKVTLDVIVSGDSNLAVAGAQFNIAADSKFGKPTATGSEAYDSALEYNKDRNEYAFGQNIGDGKVAKDGAVILSIEYTVPTDIEAGKYPVTWSDLFVSDTNGLNITDKVETVAGAIIIDEVFDGEIAWDIPEVTAKPGETVKLDVVVKDTEKAGIPVAGAQFKITADTAEFVSVDEKTAAYDAAIENNPKTNEFAFGQNAGKGTVADDGAKIFTLTYTAPTAPGVYPVKWSESFISDTNGNELTNITLLDGSITVVNDVAEGEVSWVIPEVDAEPGDTVTMEVYVDGSSTPGLAVAGAQFVIKADTPIVYNSSVGSDAYDAELINNAKTNEFAFAQGIGNGIAAKDKDNVLILTYEVPDDCADGKYPVKWSDAFISDTNGNDITSKVKLVDGAINIKAKTTTTTTTQTTTTPAPTTTTTTTTFTAPSGAIVWKVDEVDAYPGDTVTVNVKVVDTAGAKLPVGGAQFIVDSADGVDYTSAKGSDAYSATAEVNGKEIAFAHSKGEGIAADDGAVVVALTFEVPDDCEAGKYPVTLSELFASDTNGLDITSQILVMEGFINVIAKTTTTTTTQATTTTTTTTQTTTTTSAPTTTTTTTTFTAPSGAIIWKVDEVDAYPGDTVTVNVKVIDNNNAKLPVGGAQFIIDSADGVDYTSAKGSDAYSATAEVNGKEIAFAHSKGEGIAADDGAVVVALTFKVPDDCEAGKYPVTLSELFASDTNGLDITSQILVMEGFINVIAKTTTTTTTQATTTTTTTTQTTTTTSAPTTTTTTTIVSGAIIWQIDEVEAEAGETVTVNMVVKDTNDTKLPVGGAQFVIKADSPIGHGESSGTPYGAELVGNDTTDEYAFANSKGEGVAAATGDIVISLTYTVPDDCAAGRYPVTITELFASDSNGLDITKNILTIDGAIIVKAKTTTTTTTTSAPTTTTTTTSAPTTTTTTSAPTTTTTTSAPTTTTTTTSAPTTTTTTTSAPTTTTTTTTSGGLGGSDLSNTTTSTTNGSVLPGSDSNTTTTTTQTTTTTTTGTTTTTTLTYPHYYADLTTEIGFYFSHDDGRRENGIVGEGGFSKEQVNISNMYRVDYEGATPEEVTFDPEKITFNGATPATVYDKANKTFKYEVPVFYDFGTDGEEDIRPLLDADKNQVVITVYIGVKGDVNLDNLADAVDATQIQMYYAKLSAGAVDGTASTANTQLSLSNPIVDGPDSVYDHFAAFLGDVNANEWSETNWKLRKEDRMQLNAVDATQISMFYAYVSAHPDENTYDVWNMASPSRFGATD